MIFLCYQLAAVCDISRKIVMLVLSMSYILTSISFMISTAELVKNLYNDHVSDLTSLFFWGNFRQVEAEYQIFLLTTTKSYPRSQDLISCRLCRSGYKRHQLWPSDPLVCFISTENSSVRVHRSQEQGHHPWFFRINIL